MVLGLEVSLPILKYIIIWTTMHIDKETKKRPGLSSSLVRPAGQTGRDGGVMMGKDRSGRRVAREVTGGGVREKRFREVGEGRREQYARKKMMEDRGRSKEKEKAGGSNVDDLEVLEGATATMVNE